MLTCYLNILFFFFVFISNENLDVQEIAGVPPKSWKDIRLEDVQSLRFYSCIFYLLSFLNMPVKERKEKDVLPYSSLFFNGAGTVSCYV